MITCRPLRLAGELNMCIHAYSSQHIGDYLQTTASATSVETYTPWTTRTVKNGEKDFKKFVTRTALWSVSLPDNTGKLNTALSARCQAATNLLCRNTPSSKSVVSFIF